VPARSAIADEANEVLVSAASAWEVSTKQRLGKLGGVPEAHRAFSELVLADGFVHLPMTHSLFNSADLRKPIPFRHDPLPLQQR
jgi:PIN domain nuclease of toxin-antitoxin system